MELGIQNFTSTGNHLKWMPKWDKYQLDECKSKSMEQNSKKVYYQRMVGSLSDTRSVDPLVPESLESHRNIFKETSSALGPLGISSALVPESLTEKMPVVLGPESLKGKKSVGFHVGKKKLKIAISTHITPIK